MGSKCRAAEEERTRAKSAGNERETRESSTWECGDDEGSGRGGEEMRLATGGDDERSKCSSRESRDGVHYTHTQPRTEENKKKMAGKEDKWSESPLRRVAARRDEVPFGFV